MRLEERECRDRMEAARAAGDDIGREIATLVTRLEAKGHFDNRPHDQDRDLCNELLETLVESAHFIGKHDDDAEAAAVAKAAARRHWTMLLSDADRDLRFAQRSYMDAHWFDHLADLAADERETAGAA